MGVGFALLPEWFTNLDIVYLFLLVGCIFLIYFTSFFLGTGLFRFSIYRLFTRLLIGQILTPIVAGVVTLTVFFRKSFSKVGASVFQPSEQARRFSVLNFYLTAAKFRIDLRAAFGVSESCVGFKLVDNFFSSSSKFKFYYNPPRLLVAHPAFIDVTANQIHISTGGSRLNTCLVPKCGGLGLMLQGEVLFR